MRAEERSVFQYVCVDILCATIVAGIGVGQYLAVNAIAIHDGENQNGGSGCIVYLILFTIVLLCLIPLPGFLAAKYRPKALQTTYAYVWQWVLALFHMFLFAICVSAAVFQYQVHANDVPRAVATSDTIIDIVGTKGTAMILPSQVDLSRSGNGGVGFTVNPLVNSSSVVLLQPLTLSDDGYYWVQLIPQSSIIPVFYGIQDMQRRYANGSYDAAMVGLRGTQQGMEQVAAQEPLRHIHLSFVIILSCFWVIMSFGIYAFIECFKCNMV